MLRQLKIRNYAIIDDVEIDFTEGLNVFTGETGAGKSIIVGALSLALGERATEDVIRRGEDSCVVEATFNLKHPLHKKIGSTGLSPGGVLRIKRELRRTGRSRCWVNEQQVPLTQLRAIGNFLVDFHGQHEHQRLLEVSSHVDFLDAFGDVSRLRKMLADFRHEVADLRKRIEQREAKLREITQHEHIVIHDIEEIEKMDLKPDEDVNLEEQIRLLEHGEKIVERGTSALYDLYEGDASATSKIASAMASLGEIIDYTGELEDVQANLDQAHVIVKEAAQTLRAAIASIDLDASHLEAMRERLMAIERLKRKYGKNLAQLLDYLATLKADLGGKADLEEELRELKNRLHESEQRLGELCLELREKRKSAAKRFQRLVESELKMLGIEGVRFRVVFDEVENGDTITLRDGRMIGVGEHGADYVEFFIRTNVGEQLLPLRRIASGGEISRVMLALKKLLAGADEVETLIFDEIDAGIGGSLAEVVSEKLGELAGRSQVICVTHLAQIAAAARTHFAVEKKVEKGRTLTRVRQLNGKERVSELTRMIGGRRPPRSARAHAESILRRMEVK